MKIIHLTLKKKWFDMILSGEKKEEYREIKKYWDKRFIENGKIKQYDVIIFKNGYSKDAPTIEIKCLNIAKDYGNTLWGAELDTFYYSLSLGNIIKTSNIKVLT